MNFLLLTWTPKYLQDNFHFALGKLWYLGMIPWIGACFTVLLDGKLSDALRKKTGSLKIARSWFAVVSLLCTAICFMFVPTVHSVAGVLFLMALGNAFNFLPNSVYWVVVVDTEPSRAGGFGGVTHFITNIATVVAPTLTGFLVTSSGYTAMFVADSIAALLRMVSMMFVNPGKRRKLPQSINAQALRWAAKLRREIAYRFSFICKNSSELNDRRQAILQAVGTAAKNCRCKMSYQGAH